MLVRKLDFIVRVKWELEEKIFMGFVNFLFLLVINILNFNIF